MIGNGTPINQSSAPRPKPIAFSSVRFSLGPSNAQPGFKFPSGAAAPWDEAQRNPGTIRLHRRRDHPIDHARREPLAGVGVVLIHAPPLLLAPGFHGARLHGEAPQASARP